MQKIDLIDLMKREAKAKMIYAERGGHAAERAAFDRFQEQQQILRLERENKKQKKRMEMNYAVRNTDACERNPES